MSYDEFLDIVKQHLPLFYETAKSLEEFGDIFTCSDEEFSKIFGEAKPIEDKFLKYVVELCESKKNKEDVIKELSNNPEINVSDYLDLIENIFEHHD